MAEYAWEWRASPSFISCFLESCCVGTEGHFAGERWLVGALFLVSCRQVLASLSLLVPGSRPQSCPQFSFSVESIDVLGLLFLTPFLLHQKEVSGSFVYHFLSFVYHFFF